jgi:hypothetical protein
MWILWLTLDFCHLKIKSGLILEDLKFKSALNFLLPLGEKVQVEGEKGVL